MNATRFAGAAILVVSFLLWAYGGARKGFYATYHEVEKIDEITGLSYPERVDGFLPGVETLVLGFVLFAALLVASLFLESKAESS